MNKWDELRDYLKKGLILAYKMNDKNMKITLKSALKKMDNLDGKIT